MAMPKVDFKQLLIEKGERVGLGVAAALLVLFLAMGTLSAFSSQSPDKITKEIANNISSLQQKQNNGTADVPPIDDEVMKPADVRLVSRDDAKMPNLLFDPNANVVERRTKPKVLPPTSGKIDFVRGSVGIYDIVGDKIAILVGKERRANDPNQIKGFLRRRKQPPAATPPVANRPPTVPVPGQPGGPPPGLGGGGGKFGGGALGGGGIGGAGSTGPSGSDGGAPTQVQEVGIQYVSLDSPDLDRAKLAENLMPKRMAVVYATVPYRKQVEEFQRALRYRSLAELAADPTGIPSYRSFDVERRVLAADGKTEVEPWKTLDFESASMELYSKAAGWQSQQPEYLREFLKLRDVLPLPLKEHRLFWPLPKLERGQYGSPADMPQVVAALDELAKAGTPPTVLQPGSRKERIKKEGNIFDQLPDEVVGGMFPGAPPGYPPSQVGDTVNPTNRANIPNYGPGRPGASDAAGGTLQNNQTGFKGLPEVWLLRFFDDTIAPGYCYQYRIRLKAANPNYKLPKIAVASIGLTEGEELDPSEWFEVEQTLRYPSDDYLYAVEEKLVQPNPLVAGSDKTQLQIHHWFDVVRVNGDPRPLGEWVVAEIEGVRGQFVNQTKNVKVPIWQMAQTAFLFADSLSSQKSQPGRKREEGTAIDLIARPEVLVVDFEGGDGTYPSANRKQIPDKATVEVLLLTGDGKVVTARSSVADKADPERQRREAEFKEWQLKVELDSRAIKLRNLNPLGGPPGGGPTPPGGVPPGGGRDS
jgi:hypothetical protein